MPQRRHPGNKGLFGGLLVLVAEGLFGGLFVLVAVPAPKAFGRRRRPITKRPPRIVGKLLANRA
jgi:hypothetical protein